MSVCGGGYAADGVNDAELGTQDFSATAGCQANTELLKLFRPTTRRGMKNWHCCPAIS
jgi:hypothetical protein